ncbi:MAG: glutamine-hydrolyzing GMP synthase [Methylococcaceae bacterium]|nr:glutamine-hydrolyzing GMP synthase [Methylococcaceae bacterium]
MNIPTTRPGHGRDIHSRKILILDFGSQTTQLIARRVRECGVYCEIHPYDCSEQFIVACKPRGIILSGGPETVTIAAGPQAPPVVFTLGVPVLGICYGMQTTAAQLGGRVAAASNREFGFAKVRARGHSGLLRNIEDQRSPEGYGMLDVWMSHGDHVVELPPGFKVIASTESAPIAGIADEQRQIYGLQFHPEVTHTLQGARIVDRFVSDICACEKLWTPQHIIEDSIRSIRDTVGSGKVLLGLSGGVDSSVVAALLHRAIAHRLICVFVDTGLLRQGEGDQVMTAFAQHMGIRMIRVNAEALYLERLANISDPEQKRKIIGNLFVEIFDREAAKLSDVEWLAQGTIYPDVIESAGAKSGKAHLIKTHHNVGGLPDIMKLKLIEPLRELFKDEVRRIGLELGLPSEMIHRHPFPGPGLGVRILGEVKKEFAELLRKADAIFIDELQKNDFYNKVSQAFAVFLPVKSVGVMGDGRRYDYVIALRAVETIDFMTARWAHLPYDFLEHVSRRIINEIEGISRVTYDISGKPPATIEWE